MDATKDLGVKVAIGRDGCGGDACLAANFDLGVLGQVEGLESKSVVQWLENQDRVGGGASVGIGVL